MSLPNGMPVSYFLFSTYPGYFFLALPIALLAGGAFWFVRFRRDRTTPRRRKAWAVLLVCYLTGLICLVLGLDILRAAWYSLLYRMDSGIPLRWFHWDGTLIPDFYRNWNGERLGNLLAFLPFGVLYPLARGGAGYGETVRAGLLCSLAIELLQPVFGRVSDINDVILNTLGTALSALVFCAAVSLAGHRKTYTPSGG